MTTMDVKEFSQAAIDEFGDKFTIARITLDDENKPEDCSITQDDLDNYGEMVWLKEPVCPKCGSELGGLLGSFTWGLAHGCGTCANCQGITLRTYHYVKDGEKPIWGYALIGF